MTDLTIALAEEIGNPKLFVGRKQEMTFYLGWAEGTKDLLSKSQAILSRRKRGKTALVQRLFNILYSNNDPRVIPFFFRVPERPFSMADFGHLFYRIFLSQYLGFRLRDPKLINDVLSLKELAELAKADPGLSRDIRRMQDLIATAPGLVWDHAQSAPHRLATAQDIRIVQIIDEFQYMNRWIYDDKDRSIQVDLCHSYMGLAESKYAPLFVTGSYIGWLTTILNHMTARFKDRELGSLTDEEALEAVYNYAGISGRPVTETTAAYITEVGYNDPFYISQIVLTDQDDPNLMSKAGVRAALQFETTYGKGFVAKIWMEYIAEGLARVNGVNGRKIVLYLAKHGDEEITRDQIKQDLELDLSDGDLADKLHKLNKADLIALGSSEFRFKGLGDPIFAAVFRKRYAEEIERVTPSTVTAEFEQEMKIARRREAWQKGCAGEYRVMCFLLLASSRGLAPSDVIFNPTPGFTLNGFTGMKKRTFHGHGGDKDEMDIFAYSKDPNDTDLIAEVKVWEKPVSNQAVEKFVEQKKRLVLARKTAFLFYSESGFTKSQEQLMRDNGVMYTTLAKLAGSQVVDGGSLAS
jgi:hypothetical protein